MALDVHKISNFDQLIRQLIKAGEGFIGLPYAVNAGSSTGDHTITIGYGYTLVRNGTLGWQRYDNLTVDLQAIGITLTTAMNAEIEAVAEALRNGNYSAADEAVSRFSSLWNQNFGALTPTQADTLVGCEAKATLDLIKGRFNQVLGPIKGTALYTKLESTSEMAALFSRAYTGIATIRTDLVKALSDGNRAEAWFVMRYKLTTTAPENFNGAAARQYVESNVFGLYNNPANVQLTEAKDVYKMFQKNRLLIYNHESLYGEKFDGADGTRNHIVVDNASNSKYRDVLNTYGNVKTITESLNPAKSSLLADLRTRYSELAATTRLNDDQVKSPNIFLNPHKPTDTIRTSTLDARPFESGSFYNDVIIGMDQRDEMFGGKGDDDLLGEAGNDALYGGEGSDWLEGGQGNDTLRGGADNDYLYGGDDFDTYIIEGNDRIIDSDGKGIVKDKNGKIIAGAFIKQADGSYIWANDTQVTATKNSPLTLYLPDGSSVVIEDFGINGDLGIRLLENPADPITTNTITGNDYANNYTDTSANDKIATGGGDDTIVADAGGSDEILGGSGRDAISAGYGDDIAEGGTESDIVFGGGGNDEIFGDTSGNMEDIISAGETATNINEKGDLVSGNDGNDLLYGSNKKDALFGGEGHDLLVAAGGDDVIYGDHDATGAWIDWSYTVSNNQANFANVATEQGAPAGDDTIYAGTGNDLVYAGGADDEVDAGEGNDTVFGEAGDDFITGAGGNDTLVGDGLQIAASEHGSDYIDGGAGSDTIWGGGGSDDLFGGEGNDYIVGDDGIEGAGNDYIDGEAGDDIIHGSAGSDTIFGGEDNDTLVGDGANDGAGDDYLDGEAGNDKILGGDGDDEIYGGEGDDWLQGDSGNDYIDGEAGADKILGGDGDDEIYGGEGDDIITGGKGSDYIDGGAGNDTLYGETGNDTYVFGIGNGQDIITDTDTTAGNTDTIVFAPDILQSDILAQRDIDDLVLSFIGTNDKLTVKDYFRNDSPVNKIERIQFQDSTIWDVDVVKQLVLHGTKEGNIIYGYDSADTINGFGGNDILDGMGGDDIIDAGDGNDYVFGGNGNDIIYGGEGNDRIDGGYGANTLYGGDGDDYLTDGNTLYGESGNDTLIGGNGYNNVIYGGPGDDYMKGGKAYDTLYGGPGRDIMDGGEWIDILWGDDGDDYLYGNSGNDSLFGGRGDDWLNGGSGFDFLDGGEGNDYLYGYIGDDKYKFGIGSGKDTIREEADSYWTRGQIDIVNFGLGITLSDLEFIKEGSYNLKISIKGTSDVLTIENWFLGNRIERFEFADGTALRPAGIEAIGYKVYGTVGNDTLYGSGVKDEIYGYEGSDTLSGGAGNDTLNGGSGDDTYIYNIGDGIDIIQDIASVNGGNILEFGDPRITPAYLFLRLGSLAIGVGDRDSGDEIHIENFDPNDAYGPHAIETFQFADGNSISYSQLIDKGFDLTGTTGNDTITGTNVVDRITGLKGNDTLIGNSGNDTLTGGTGNDELIGGAGSDTYVFNLGDGVDTIDDIATDAEGNLIVFGEGITRDNLKLAIGEGQTANGMLTISIGEDGDVIRVVNFNSDNPNIRTVEFADGTQVPLKDLLDPGTEGDDIITTGAGNDVIKAKGGNDIVNTNGGNDTIDGGSGDDVINAGTGSDTVNAGEGNDYIDGGEGADIMTGNAGDDTYIVDSEGDLVTENANEGADLIQSSITYALTDNVENLTLIEDPDFIGTGISDINGTGNILDNIITGNSGNNILDGGEGVDTLIGGAGNDTYYIDNIGDAITENAGEGIDTVNSGITYTLGNNLENLILNGTDNINASGNELNNVITGNTGNNIIDGKEGADTMTGEAGDDTYIVDNAGDVVNELADEGIDTVYAGVDYTLTDNVENLILTGDSAINGIGNELNNVIAGNSAANILTGGLGDDTIIGGSGDDTINAGEGADIITGGTGNDTINGGEGNDIYTYNIGDGLDTLNDSAGIDTLQMGAGIDFDHTIIRLDNLVAHLRLLDEEGNETADGMDITLNAYGTIPVETINFADGTSKNIKDLVIAQKTSSGTNKGETISAGRNDDTIYAYNGIDTVYAGLSNDTVYGENGSDTLYGEAGNDILYGENGNDTLDGGNGKDVLYGGNGDDVLTGGKGNDTLYGESGSDTYKFNRNDGQDTIIDTGGDADSVLFNVNPLDLIFSRSGNDLVLKISDSPTDQMTVKDWYSGASNQTEIFQTSDGDKLLNTQVEQLIQAMASFSTDNGMSWSEAIQQKPQEAQAVLAQYWEKNG